MNIEVKNWYQGIYNIMFKNKGGLMVSWAILLILCYIGIEVNRKYHNMGFIIKSETSEINKYLDKMDVMIKRNSESILNIANKILAIEEKREVEIISKEDLRDNANHRLIDVTKKINLLNVLCKKIEISESIDELSFLLEQFEQIINDPLMKDIISKNLVLFEHFYKMKFDSQKMLLNEFSNVILPKIKSIKNRFRINFLRYKIDTTRYIFFPSDVKLFHQIQSNIIDKDIANLVNIVENNIIVEINHDIEQYEEINAWMIKSKNNLYFLNIILEMRRVFENFISSI